MKNFNHLIIRFFTYLILLAGFSVLFMSVPICFLLINASLKLHSLFPLIATFGWCFIVLKSIQYFHKKYFPESVEQEVVSPIVATENQAVQTIATKVVKEQSTKNKNQFVNLANLVDKETIHQILHSSLISMLIRAVSLGILVSVINFVLLPILVIDVVLLIECQINVSIYGLSGGLLFIVVVCAINDHQKKDKMFFIKLN